MHARAKGRRLRLKRTGRSRGPLMMVNLRHTAGLAQVPLGEHIKTWYFFHFYFLNIVYNPIQTDHMRVNAIKSKYKIVLLGDQHVGKTAIINRFIHNSYDPTYSATIGIDFLVKNISYRDKHYRIQLWDTAGQERFKSLIPSYLKDSSCCLIVYDVSNNQSLENAFKWLELYNQHKNSKAVSVLIGNKMDIQEREIIGPVLEQKLRSSKLRHYLVSAKQGSGINEAFEKVVAYLDSHLQSLSTTSRQEEQDEKEIKTAQTMLKSTDNTFHLQETVGFKQQQQAKQNCCM